MRFREPAEMRRMGSFMTKAWKAALAAAAILLNSWAMAEEGPREDGQMPADHPSAAMAADPAPDSGFGASVGRTQGPMEPGPCERDELTAAPMRPNWTNGAATTQCGSLETDYGWLWQGMGAQVSQRMYPVSVRYGLTTKLELRWGLPTPLSQSGGGIPALKGVADQWIGGLYRFHEQEKRMPALGLGYNYKVPTANLAKGFGSGYADHQLMFIASQDLKKLHFDFNVVGTLAGGTDGPDGAAQYGLAMSASATRQVTWILETDGGPQPGTADRFGQALGGGSWAVRPWLVLDAAYTRAYTAGTPRQQVTFGWTWASRPEAVARTRARVTRWLER